MAKLTLSVDDIVVSRAKRYASEHGTSVSKIVEKYLTSIAPEDSGGDLPPILKSLRGIAKRADPAKDYIGEYRDHLENKYR